MPAIAARIAAARRGVNPALISAVRSGWAVLADQQFLRGYCLLLCDPSVPSLNDLRDEARRNFLEDMAALGDAILTVTRPNGAVRINYSIYGNLEPQLHAHLIPRYSDEPEEFRTMPAWLYPAETREARPFDPEKDRLLVHSIRDELRRLGVVA
jgi:diadenosine tetraphosphate (Ap4A) HIT family hydrolase